MRSLIAIAALLACSGAWAEVTSLYCETVEENIGLSPFTLTIDLDAKIADRLPMVNEGEAGTFAPFPYDVVAVTPNLIELTDRKFRSGARHSEVSINRATLLAKKRWFYEGELQAHFPFADFQCKLVDTPKAKI